MPGRVWPPGFYEGSGRALNAAELCFEVAEARYWRAQAMALHQPPDTLPEDLLLLEPVMDEHGRQVGIQPARSVRNEYQRCARWLEDTYRKAAACSGA